MTIDRAAFDGTDPADLEVVAGVGSAEYSTFRPVQETASGHRFGGAKAGAVNDAPLLIDVTTPSNVSQKTAFSYSAEELATLPFVSLDQE